jgi:hypothetical protein
VEGGHPAQSAIFWALTASSLLPSLLLAEEKRKKKTKNIGGTGPRL